MATLEEAVARLKITLSEGPWRVNYNNDTGPDDEGFWEWYEVAGIRFDSEDTAIAFLAVLQA